jgi:Ribonuclease P
MLSAQFHPCVTLNVYLRTSTRKNKIDIIPVCNLLRHYSQDFVRCFLLLLVTYQHPSKCFSEAMRVKRSGQVLKLSRLPNPSTRLKSLNVRNHCNLTTQGSSAQYTGNTPGEVLPLLKRSYGEAGYTPKNWPLVKSLDRLATTKSVNFHPWNFPASHTPGFVMRIVPKMLLSKPDVNSLPVVRLKVRDSRRCTRSPAQLNVRLNQTGRANMSVAFTISKKVHKLAVIRSRIRHRITEALGLIVTRGANGEASEQEIEVTENDIGAEKWILQGSFCFHMSCRFFLTLITRLDIRCVSKPDSI